MCWNWIQPRIHNLCIILWFRHILKIHFFYDYFLLESIYLSTEKTYRCTKYFCNHEVILSYDIAVDCGCFNVGQGYWWKMFVGDKSVCWWICLKLYVGIFTNVQKLANQVKISSWEFSLRSLSLDSLGIFVNFLPSVTSLDRTKLRILRGFDGIFPISWCRCKIPTGMGY